MGRLFKSKFDQPGINFCRIEDMRINGEMTDFATIHNCSSGGSKSIVKYSTPKGEAMLNKALNCSNSDDTEDAPTINMTGLSKRHALNILETGWKNTLNAQNANNSSNSNNSSGTL